MESQAKGERKKGRKVDEKMFFYFAFLINVMNIDRQTSVLGTFKSCISKSKHWGGGTFHLTLLFFSFK